MGVDGGKVTQAAPKTLTVAPLKRYGYGPRGQRALAAPGTAQGAQNMVT